MPQPRTLSVELSAGAPDSSSDSLASGKLEFGRRAPAQPSHRDQREFAEFEEASTGSYIFENEWQSFRTRKDRSL